MMHYILRAKIVEGIMVDNIEKTFLLEQILKIVNFEEKHSLEELQKKFSKELFEIDYVQLEALRKRIGDIGERYVFEREMARLEKANSKYADCVDNTPAEDPQNGYDILSYTEDGVPIHIEVKSTLGDLHTPFYITANEKETSKRIRNEGGIYQIHRVYNIGNGIDVFVYENDDMFVFEEVIQRVTIKGNEKL